MIRKKQAEKRFFLRLLSILGTMMFYSANLNSRRPHSKGRRPATHAGHCGAGRRAETHAPSQSGFPLFPDDTRD